MPEGKKWQAHVNYGPPGRLGETLATADSLKELLVKIEEARGPDLILNMIRNDQIFIDIFYGELSE